MTVSVRRLDTQDRDFDSQLDALLAWDPDAQSGAAADSVRSAVAATLSRVRAEGDAAVLDLTARFDDFAPKDMAAVRISADELAQAFAGLPEAERDALQLAAERIRYYHERQLADAGVAGFEFADALGNTLGQRVSPLARVGVYVPGGQAAYPSTVLMTVIPARVAGVPQVVMTVPTPAGVRQPMVLAAAHLAGVDEVLTLGGAQAVAALAFGTESVAKVDKIVGPGGAFVAEAKRQVFGQVGIDVIAGPSEVLIVADGSAPPAWMALDLFSQAEHDPHAQALLVSPDAAHLDAVAAAMRELLDAQPRATTISESLTQRGALIKARDMHECLQLANRIAPEHLELAVAEPRRWLDQVQNAGAVFLGSHSPEVLGDYVAGPSHVLPTFGTARFSSPLGVHDFLKRTSVIGMAEAGAEPLARAAATLADGEGLQAHASAAQARVAGVDHNR